MTALGAQSPPARRGPRSGRGPACRPSTSERRRCRGAARRARARCRRRSSRRRGREGAGSDSCSGQSSRVARTCRPASSYWVESSGSRTWVTSPSGSASAATTSSSPWSVAPAGRAARRARMPPSLKATAIERVSETSLGSASERGVGADPEAGDRLASCPTAAARRASGRPRPPRCPARSPRRLTGRRAARARAAPRPRPAPGWRLRPPAPSPSVADGVCARGQHLVVVEDDGRAGRAERSREAALRVGEVEAHHDGGRRGRSGPSRASSSPAPLEGISRASPSKS